MVSFTSAIVAGCLAYASAVTASSACLGAVMNQTNTPAVYPGSPEYEFLMVPFNLRIKYKPLAIALPANAEDVKNAIHAAAECGIRIQAKSGGHSYSSYSSGGQDGSLVIDLQKLTEVTVDADGVAAVGGGVRVGNMDLAIYNQSRGALSHGTCPDVGVGGHYLHGGYGYDSRLWGLAIDAIVGVEAVVPGHGAPQILNVNTTNDPQGALWALRGAADSFGVVTKLFLKTNPAPEKVTVFTYNFTNFLPSVEDATKHFLHIQDFSLNASVVNRNISFGTFTDGKVFLVRGKFFGSEEEWAGVSAELLRGLPEPNDQSTVVTDGWIESQIYFSGFDTIAQPLTGYNLHDDFFAKSVTIPESHPLTEETLKSYFKYIIEKGNTEGFAWFSIVNLYGGPDSQINSNPATPLSAYPDRASLWVVQNYANVPFTSNQTNQTFPANALTFIEGLNDALTSPTPDVEYGAYLNYIDPTLSRDEAKELYFEVFPNGTAVYDKLVEIKGQLDPFDIFWNPQSIPLPHKTY